MRLLPCGDRAILVDLADERERRRLDGALRSAPIREVVEHVPAARTVLVRVGAAADLPAVAEALRRLDVGQAEPTSRVDGGTLLEVPVRYDGPDLAAVADLLGITTADVVTRHTGQVWTVDFAGFAPGFGYLVGDVGGLEVPRLEVPRIRVPTGAVGLAGEYSGVYPSPSPGGWRLIGTTEFALWDPYRDPPALLTPGRRVRFVEVAT